MKSKALSLAAAAFFLAGSASVGFAQSSHQTPGHQMQERGSVKGSPGASGYAPGQQMQQKGSKPGQPGASGYAPGNARTGTPDKTHSNTGSR